MYSIQPKGYSLSGGIELSFTDVGAPPNSDDYTTVFILHGSVFNAYQFHKVHSYAHNFNLRTVLLHRRGYIGSTPYTPAELQELERGSKTFWEQSSAQLAEFLGMFIEKEKIPKLKEHPRSGGIAILGWSMGAIPVLSFFATAKNALVSTGLLELLEGYIGKCVLYDPPYLALGYPLPSDNPNYIPWVIPDPTVSPEEVPAVFSQWIGSYYDHPCYDSASRRWRSSASIYDFDGSRPGGDKKNSLSSWSEEEIAKGIEQDATTSESLVFEPAVQEAVRELANQALFDPKNIEVCFPRADVAYIGATRTAWACAWAEIQVKKRYRSKEGRQMRFLDMDGCNHFAHWDQPQQFVQVIAECIKSDSCLGS
ncbi:hypothetical protein GYMLUDRAFT_214581 [Collybiopsis luxurians FD-317 M1]|nr:hypothetical protein GYMLUDRAFT_214581 [Collybiopsis luxurians FD-317 M1]